jgi:hypothetical protein
LLRHTPLILPVVPRKPFTGKTQNKLGEMAREENDRGKMVKIGYRKVQINGEWFTRDEREEKVKENV